MGYFPKYSELAVSKNGKWLLFSYELEIPNQEPKNAIGLLDLSKAELQEAVIIVEGADFYKTPQFSPDTSKISWLEWNHPYMPWDSTKIYEAQFIDGKISNPIKISGSDNESISDSCYLSNNDLVFAKDHRDEEENSYKNYYNLYLSQNGKVTSVTQELMDLQQLRCYNDKIYVQAFNLGRPQILVFEKDHLTNGFKKKSIEIDPVSFLTPVPSKNKLYLAATYSKAPSQIIEFNLDSHNTKMIKISTSLNVDEENISEGQMIIFPTTDGKLSYGYFYPPVNKNFCAAPGEQPPVRVLIHGGPTGMTTLGFSKKLMFWTSQGYAVFDVNYRGSFGFDRKYRDALLNNWGILEIQDVKDGLAELRQQKLIGDKAVVSGGSAGGYTVQRLLTFYPDMFAAGASHFGIGNLITLQKLTHKFEIHYLEQLIGGTLETNLKEYENRSPINHLVNLKSPMIIFQGSDDKVVAPENSREIASILKRKGIRYEYYEYEGEGHGFRKKENLVNSLIKESNFFKSVLSSTDK